jgi:electron transfer flavoprotein beta subunit
MDMAELNILVCVKQVPDPEGPPSAFEVDSAARKVTPKGIPPVLSPFDENALEAAIRVKEAAGGSITMLSVGNNLSKAVMLKALASGADRLVTVEDPSCDQEGLDAFATASLLAAAVRKAGPFDLILTGRQAADTNAGQVGLGLAQLLSIPAVSVAGKVEVNGGTARVETVLPDGYEVVEASLPLLVTVSHEVGDLRYPSLMAIKKAKTLPMETFKPADLGMEPGSLVINEITELTAPNRERRCRLVEGESPEDAGAKLAALLKEDKII